MTTNWFDRVFHAEVKNVLPAAASGAGFDVAAPPRLASIWSGLVKKATEVETRMKAIAARIAIVNP